MLHHVELPEALGDVPEVVVYPLLLAIVQEESVVCLGGKVAVDMRPQLKPALTHIHSFSPSKDSRTESDTTPKFSKNH